jgi:hypothetical protein
MAEHPIVEVATILKRKIDSVANGWEMSSYDCELSESLSALTSNQACEGKGDLGITYNLNNEVQPTQNVYRCPIPSLLNASKPSLFGRRDEDVYDERIRNGRELTSNEITIDYPVGAVRFEQSEILKSEVSNTLFGGRPVELIFYKVALYETGGKIDMIIRF